MPLKYLCRFEISHLDFNSTKGKKERVGRMMMMHSNNREEIDEAFVSNVIEVGMIWELVCAILSFVGGALLVMRQNYNLVLVGCAAAIVGLGGLLLSTLCGASALYFTFQSKPEFGINEQDESW